MSKKAVGDSGQHLQDLQDRGAWVSEEAEGDSRVSARPRPVLWLTCTQRAGDDNEFTARY